MLFLISGLFAGTFAAILILKGIVLTVLQIIALIKCFGALKRKPGAGAVGLGLTIGSILYPGSWLVCLLLAAVALAIC